MMLFQNSIFRKLKKCKSNYQHHKNKFLKLVLFKLRMLINSTVKNNKNYSRTMRLHQKILNRYIKHVAHAL